MFYNNKKIILLSFLFVIFLFPQKICASKKTISKILESEQLKNTQIGLKVIDINTGKTLIKKNSDKLFTPASSVKLLTGYAALKILSPQFTFNTEFSTDIFIDSHTLHNLYIKSSGDPSLTLYDIEKLARTLSEKIDTIEGDIIVDNFFFDALSFGKGWMWDEGNISWNAPIAPYNLNGNCIKIILKPNAEMGGAVNIKTIPATNYIITVTSAITSNVTDITIRREEIDNKNYFYINGTLDINSTGEEYIRTISSPELYTAHILTKFLIENGVNFQGDIYVQNISTTTVLIHKYTSKNLGTIMIDFLKDSNNLTGECILKTLGALEYVEPGESSNGIKAIQEELNKLGIKEKKYRIVDGSGISRYNLLSANIITKLLKEAYNDFSIYPEFANALAIAGTDGTLKKRLQSTGIKGYFRGKTGSMSGINCVSGYLQTKKGNMLAISILINGFIGPPKKIVETQDKILKTLWEHY